MKNTFTFLLWSGALFIIGGVAEDAHHYGIAEAFHVVGILGILGSGIGLLIEAVK